MVEGFLYNIVFKERDLLDKLVLLDVFGHGRNGEKFIISFLVLYFVVSDSSEWNSQILIEVSFLVINDVKTIWLLAPIHVTKLFI